MICKICGKEIKRGKGYKGTRFKTEHFCSEDCYNKRVKQSEERKVELAKNKYKPKEGTDRRKLTDLIQSIYGENANWPELMANARNIENEYNLNDKEFRLVIRYAIKYDEYLPDINYNLYQFIKFIEPMRAFREQLNINREVEILEDKIVHVKQPSKKRYWYERG